MLTHEELCVGPQVSTSLKNALCTELFKDVIADLPFFQHRDPSYIAHVCVHLRPFFALEGQPVVYVYASQ